VPAPVLRLQKTSVLAGQRRGQSTVGWSSDRLATTAVRASRPADQPALYTLHLVYGNYDRPGTAVGRLCVSKLHYFDFLQTCLFAVQCCECPTSRDGGVGAMRLQMYARVFRRPTTLRHKEDLSDWTVGWTDRRYLSLRTFMTAWSPNKDDDEDSRCTTQPWPYHITPFLSSVTNWSAQRTRHLHSAVGNVAENVCALTRAVYRW